MGLNQKQDILFLNVSCGQLVNKKLDVSGYSYTGHLVSISHIIDNYEGKDLPKIAVKMVDDKGKFAQIKFTAESYFSLGFFQRIFKCDFNKEITIGCSQSEQNEKITFCWIKQGEQIIKKDEDFPKPKKMTVGKQTVTDWTEFSAKALEIIEAVKEKLSSRIKDGTIIESDADLPFDEQPEHNPASEEIDLPPNEPKKFGR
jgi:hypothetical protein